jgi:3-hydroxy-9,10-secoandrosta-1,3,5(10)-triene-9,17-dione monooxygenase reductase component
VSGQELDVLAEDQEHVCRSFASKEPDKFRGIGWEPGSTGAPRILDVVAWIDCTIETIHDAGDHDICVGRIQELKIEREIGPLVFFRGGYGKFAI